jgi:hypothetical protein
MLNSDRRTLLNAILGHSPTAARQTGADSLAGLEVGPRADLLSAARCAHAAGQSHVAIRGACTAARGDQHALAITEKANAIAGKTDELDSPPIAARLTR